MRTVWSFEKIRDRNLHAQHFRLKTGSGRYECTAETEVIDSNGGQWLKCHYCGAVGNANTFFSRGHGAFINHGICRDCWGRGHKYIR